MSTDGEVMAKIKVACFFLGHGVETKQCKHKYTEWSKKAAASSVFY